ncbi:MAG: hypothetical protein IPH12_04005 [Saprospirales bacterium]|nr:hypothetical protein [Saprospirales bacterium]MBK8922564.1 hypothetical protein [Saprospirales bacterium]
MKKLYRTGIAGALVFSAAIQQYAQPTLTNTVFPSIGDQLISAGADTIGVLPGNAGANQTWNFPVLLPSTPPTEDTAIFVTPVGTAYFSTFPDANVAVVSGGGDFYTYFKKESNKFRYFGGAGAGFTLLYTDPETILETPLSYNGSFSDTYESVTSSSGITLYTEGQKTVKYDAYGTLTLPTGVYANAMRVKSVHTIVDSTSLGAGYIVNTITETSYDWFVNGTPGVLLTIEYESGTSKTVFPPLPPIVAPIPPSKTVIYQKYSVSGVSDPEQSQATITIEPVRPNPAGAMLRVLVQAAENIPDAELSMINTGGQVVYRQALALAPGENSLSIPVGHLMNGVYWLQIRSKQVAKSVAWVKE